MGNMAVSTSDIDVYMGSISVQWPVVEVAFSTFGPLWPVFIYTAICLNINIIYEQKRRTQISFMLLTMFQH